MGNPDFRDQVPVVEPICKAARICSVDQMSKLRIHNALNAWSPAQVLAITGLNVIASQYSIAAESAAKIIEALVKG